jgi:hypothetical protein
MPKDAARSIIVIGDVAFKGHTLPWPVERYPMRLLPLSQWSMGSSLRASTVTHNLVIIIINRTQAQENMQSSLTQDGSRRFLHIVPVSFKSNLVFIDIPALQPYVQPFHTIRKSIEIRH